MMYLDGQGNCVRNGKWKLLTCFGFEGCRLVEGAWQVSFIISGSPIITSALAVINLLTDLR